MAESSISLDQDHFRCPVCLDLLKDPVTTACGHSFCKVCINDCWDEEFQRRIYRCPQCRATFTPRPVLHRNYMLAEVVEKLKNKTEVQAASSVHCYAGPGDAECDLCSRRKRKAVKFCLMCQASFCEFHLKLHYEVPSWKKHKLVETSGNLREKICCDHDEDLKIYSHNDQSYICYSCTMEEHRGHDKQSLCVSPGRKDSHIITDTRRLSFDGLRKSASKMKNRFEEFCPEKFIQIPHHVAAIKMILPPTRYSRDEFFTCMFKTPSHMCLDFCDLTLDPNTVNYYLVLSKNNRAVTHSETKQPYADHPERFKHYSQVLSKESVCGRCYWEVEWRSKSMVYISVLYKDMNRKDWGNECWFGYNDRSWSLRCTPTSVHFYHNNVMTDLRAPSSSRIGVYVDHGAGTLSFYGVSGTMKLLHSVRTTFTQPLYIGFSLCGSGTSVRLCDLK